MTRQDDDAWINDDEAEELELKSKQRVGTTHNRLHDEGIGGGVSS